MLSAIRLPPAPLVKAASRGAAACITTPVPRAAAAAALSTAAAGVVASKAPKRAQVAPPTLPVPAFDAFLSPSGAVLVPSFGALPFPTIGGVRSRIERSYECSSLLIWPRRSRSTSASGPPSETEAKAPSATVNPSAEDDRALIDRLPEALRKSFEATWEAPALRKHLLEKLSSDPDFENDQITALALELKEFKRIPAQGVSLAREASLKAMDEVHKSASVQRIVTTFLIWVEQWSKNQGPSYPTDVRELKRAPDQQRYPGDWPEHVDPVYLRYNTTKEILTEIQESIFSPNRSYRSTFNFLQVATMSGMGKTTYGANIITHLLKALEHPAPVLGFSEERRSLLTNLLTHRTQTVFIDFNGRGDGLEPEDNFRKHIWLAKRLAARGLLDLPISRASDLLSRMSNLDVKSVIRELWRRLRERQQIPDDEHALLIIHIDEYQLAHNFLRRHMTLEEASGTLANALNEILACNFDSTKNTVVVLLTATSTAGLTEYPLTVHRMKLVYLEPLSFPSALGLLEKKWNTAKPPIQLHAQWRNTREFRQFVHDVGGSPKLLSSLSAHTQLAYEPNNKTIAMVLNHFAMRLATVSFPLPVVERDVLALVDLVLTQRPVLTSTRVGQFTVEQLAYHGILTLAPAADAPTPNAMVVVGCPIPYLKDMIHQHADLTCWSAMNLFRMPFESVEDGDIFETAAHLSLTAHLRLLGTADQSCKVTSLLCIKNLTDLRGFAQATVLSRAFSPSASYVPIIEGTQILSKSNSTFNFFTRRVQGRSPWSRKQLDIGWMASCVDAPANGIPVVQTAKNTFGVDMWVLLPAEHNLYAKTKPLLVLFQLKHHQAVSQSDTFSNLQGTIETTLEKVTAGVTDPQTGETVCDVLMVVMVTGTASQSPKAATRLAADRKWAKALATLKKKPDPRVIVLMGEDVRRVVPFMWSRFPDTGDWVVPSKTDASRQADDLSI
ncbi:hypothetical protein CAOG_08960 [Capsaspora owczarzaki ATCC 30864]|uniref:hypothetical protein n=1 Tax=Capsaspora owczarzaki (strain ATCC 30864) TaxID=595528 RepID=UPI0003521A56|nr:hypothetical protein CAOG_08960 [Capsaspora owczarzaki ATCC 30864]|eukprot:XP_011270631.1 hypothetical protein CAOG_08960 [Capsaspora owczarzaki ATCC 30864]